MPLRNMLIIVIAGILWSCVVALQRPPPRYSQQFMPDTSFTCRNKIVGSYYADPETDCQVFHVCVSVAGSIQDYKFLCPNDTAFDQESQTCADWYDVDCEAATLYYASDNFDLYRIGSGLESLHYDSIRTDAEPQDHLQRSETSDPVRSAANNLNHVAQNNNYNTQSNSNTNSNNNNNNRDILRGSSSSNFYNSRNNGKDEDYDNDKSYKDEPVEPRKKGGVRKVARKHLSNNNNNINNNDNNNNNNNNGNSYFSSSTAAPSSTINYNNRNYNANYNNNFNSYNSRRTTHEPTTTSRSTSQQDYNKQYNQNNQKYNSPVTSTYRPTSVQQNYQSSSTTIRPSPFINNKNYNENYRGNFGQIPTTVKPVSYSQSLQHSPTTSRPTTYNQNYQEYFNNHQYNMQYSNNNNNNNNNNDGTEQSTTVTPSTNYQQNDYASFQQKNYNNIQRSTTTIGVSSTTSASTYVNNYNGNTQNNYNNQNNGRSSSSTTSNRQGSTPTTKFYPNYSTSSYVPTTYSPVNAKKNTNGNNNDNGQYYDKSSQQTKSTQYYDSTKTPKKATQNTNYDNTNAGKYFETSTINYDFARSQAAVGFSPSSINLLAESPRSTTPVSRRGSAPTTYNPNNYNHRVTFQQQQSTTPRGTTSGTAKTYSTNDATFTDATSPKPKSTKKNDYDYAYYDNAGGLEYDGLDLDHVARNKESSKISRN